MCLHQFLQLAKEHSSYSEKTSIFGGVEAAQKLLSKAFETKKLCNCSLQCAVSPLLPTSPWVMEECPHSAELNTGTMWE